MTLSKDTSSTRRASKGLAVAGCIAGLGLALAGLDAVIGESSAFFTRSGSQSERLQPIYDGTARISLSTYSNMLLMRDCDDAMVSPYAQLLPQEQRHAGARHCLGYAREVIASSPASGVAWIIQAKAHDLLGDTASALAAVKRSQEASAGEGWLAISRLRFLLPRTPVMGEAGEAVIIQDVTLMAMSQNGAAPLAELYKQQGANGQVLIGIIDRLPNEPKSRFLRHLRALSSQGS
ncbi:MULTISPECIES: hypothetical protein [unclassified Pannonibacter]|uniref:hypothetical protein n=1 Tax=unclassified Pannonibacter TaxID=2627228 RepID=UPI001645F65D|nr:MULTISPECIES: hypothetical protein [unclassified Pannonibacter]